MKRLVQSGFTIVELLIVIVVIAILASLTVASYSGLQSRAANASRIAGARNMVGLLNYLVSVKGPTALTSLVSTPGWYCLGENFHDLDSGAGVSCYMSHDETDNSYWYVYSLTALDNALKPLGSYELRTPNLTANSNSYTETMSGPEIFFTGQTHLVDGSSVLAFVWYVLAGEDIDCGLKPQVVEVNYVGGVTNYTAQNGARNMGTYDDVTFCKVAITTP